MHRILQLFAFDFGFHEVDAFICPLTEKVGPVILFQRVVSAKHEYLSFFFRRSGVPGQLMHTSTNPFSDQVKGMPYLPGLGIR